MKSFSEILQEQKYNNTNRIYYHGSRDPNLDLKNFFKRGENNAQCFYLTPTYDYAVQYARNKQEMALAYRSDASVASGDDSAVYHCKIIKPLNICNAKSKTDYEFLLHEIEKLLFYINDNDRIERPEGWLKRACKRAADQLVFRFKEEDWIEVIHDENNREHELSFPMRDKIIDAIKKGGYDGYYNFETEKDECGPSIGIFSGDLTSKIKILRKQIIRYKLYSDPDEDPRYFRQYGNWQ